VQSETGRNSMQGTGLGLPISKQFVNLMGGDIKVTSKVNEGSIFTFDIKLRLAEEIDYQGKTPKNREVIALQPDQPHYSILIAEDVEENRLLLIKLLSPIGFDVRTANNGEEAIAIWQEWKPDLILMDMLMPIMDGYEATRKIKAMAEDKNENIKIIAITANALSGANVAPLEAGCDDYMPKPYREEMLFEKIAEQLGVKYCYREDISFSSDSDTENFVLTRESFQVMPQDWIKKLNQGALESDEDVITDLIAQIPETNQNLAETLTQLVENYRFDLLFNLTK
jgi:CheY-like chemotaxis protein